MYKEFALEEGGARENSFSFEGELNKGCLLDEEEGGAREDESQ